MDLKNNMYPLNFWTMFGLPNNAAAASMSNFLSSSNGGGPPMPPNMFLPPGLNRSCPNPLDLIGGSGYRFPFHGLTGVPPENPSVTRDTSPHGQPCPVSGIPPFLCPTNVQGHPAFFPGGLGLGNPSSRVHPAPFKLPDLYRSSHHHGSSPPSTVHSGISPSGSPNELILEEQSNFNTGKGLSSGGTVPGLHKSGSDKLGRPSPDSLSSPNEDSLSAPILKRSVNLDSNTIICPVCKVELFESDFDLHLVKELRALRDSNLSELAITRGDLLTDSQETKSVDESDLQNSCSTTKHEYLLPESHTSESRYFNFLKIKNNRLQRTTMVKPRKRKHVSENLGSPASSDIGYSQSKQFDDDFTVSKLNHDNNNCSLSLIKRRKDIDVEGLDEDDMEEELHSGEDHEHQRLQEIACHPVNSQSPSDQVKCGVCKGHYQRPLISIECWHVYCEDCWYNSLSRRGVCPLCHTATSFNMLRQVHL